MILLIYLFAEIYDLDLPRTLRRGENVAAGTSPMYKDALAFLRTALL